MSKTQTPLAPPITSIAARAAVPVLNAKMKARGRVPLDGIHEFYEEVLTDLQISPVDTTHYGRLTAQLHSMLCIDCPHIRWVEKERSFHWVTTTALSAKTSAHAHDDEASDDEAE